MLCVWAQEEMASVDLGDARLNDRAATLLSAVGRRPNLSIPAACGGHAEMTAAYRFFDNEKVDFEKVLEPHIQRTLERMARQKTVLLVQDTTEIDLTRPQQRVAGVGELDGIRQGSLLHVIHAFTEDGTPLGTVFSRTINRARVWRGPWAEKAQRVRWTPIEKKESLRWLEGMRRSRSIAGSLPQVHCISVCDSESDIYECLAESRAVAEGGVPVHDWVIRACHDRALAEERDSWRLMQEKALATPRLYRARVQVRQRKARRSDEPRTRRQSRERRLAQVEVRAAAVTLEAPRRRGHKLPATTVHLVLVHEPHPPAGAQPIVWMLLTTLPIETAEQVQQIVRHYCVRWSIEILFRTLKSGCRIEQRRLENMQRMLPCMAIYLIVAWRTLLVSRLSRTCPEADCELLFEPSEWKAVWAVTHRSLPRKKPTLSEMVYLVAQLGGYVRRRSSEPGPQTLWIGLQRVHDLAFAWDTFGPEAPSRREENV
jgi:hypothetical protein